MLSREQTISLIDQFLKSTSPENNSLSNNKLLVQIKNAYNILNEKDKEFIRTHITNKHNEAFPQQSTIERVKKYKDGLITGTAIGLAGSAASVGTYSVVTGQFLIKKCIYPVALGTFTGTFFYPVFKNQPFNKAEHPITLLRNALGIGTTQKLLSKL